MKNTLKVKDLNLIYGNVVCILDNEVIYVSRLKNKKTAIIYNEYMEKSEIDFETLKENRKGINFIPYEFKDKIEKRFRKIVTFLRDE